MVRKNGKNILKKHFFLHLILFVKVFKKYVHTHNAYAYAFWKFDIENIKLTRAFNTVNTYIPVCVYVE